MLPLFSLACQHTVTRCFRCLLPWISRQDGRCLKLGMEMSSLSPSVAHLRLLYHRIRKRPRPCSNSAVLCEVEIQVLSLVLLASSCFLAQWLYGLLPDWTVVTILSKSTDIGVKVCFKFCPPSLPRYYTGRGFRTPYFTYIPSGAASECQVHHTIAGPIWRAANWLQLRDYTKYSSPSFLFVWFFQTMSYYIIAQAGLEFTMVAQAGLELTIFQENTPKPDSH